MARLPLVDPDGAGSPAAAAEAERSGWSVNPNVIRAMANHPEALDGFVRLGSAVYFQNSLSPAQRELAYLTASVVNQCHY
ncbi:MAG TPA: carboxymuconolactone decarboxylase family protein [Acidimicrobiales bacterium]|nr:carboxymuconolactone decarboxylase family protein [Acidimicrobiales bacterium]